MNGIDHMLPDDNTGEVARELAAKTGWEVHRGLLDEYVAELGQASGEDLADHLPVHEGELIGGRAAHLLPGVWSTHSDLKLANRRCETELLGWTEPFVELGRLLGAPDERPALRMAWRELLPNQAHDSICGCSQDRVHVQMLARYDSIIDLATETSTRILERLAGLGTERQIIPDPETGEIEIAVFNPSPHPRNDLVRLPLEGFPAFTKRGINPLLQANFDPHGFHVDDQPVRLDLYAGTVRPRLSPDKPVWDLEFVARDVPAFGLAPLSAHPGREDRRPCGPGPGHRSRRHPPSRSRTLEPLSVRFGDRDFQGLCGLEDIGDRGDTYDFDPVGD